MPASGFSRRLPQLALTLIHHAVFFSLQALSWTHVLHTLLRIDTSDGGARLSVGFIWIIAMYLHG
ncbi:MAG: hypothetical protein ACLUNS_10480 [Alistipes shahii]